MKILKILLLSFLFIISCASVKNRISDTSDVIEFQYGAGLGLQLFVGPLKAGIGAFTNDLYKSAVLGVGKGVTGNMYYESYTDLGFLNDRIEREKYYPDDVELPVYQYTRLNLCVGILVGVCTGVNIGEFLDLLSGFVFLDIYEDDIYSNDKLMDLQNDRINHIREISFKNPLDSKVNFEQAEKHCKDKGLRLPTFLELQKSYNNSSEDNIPFFWISGGKYIVSKEKGKIKEINTNKEMLVNVICVQNNYIEYMKKIQKIKKESLQE